jgi:hypothetical protein
MHDTLTCMDRHRRLSILALNSLADQRFDMPIFSSGRWSQIRKIDLWIAIALFIVSLFSPAISLEQNYVIDRICLDPHWELGLGFFVIGPLGVPFGQFGWFANPLMLVAVLTPKTLGVICALASVALTVQTAYSVSSFWSDGQVPADVCGFGPGYYLWIACSVLVLVATLLKPPTSNVSPQD